jgi:anthranilate phosphoribosyltransferase
VITEDQKRFAAFVATLGRGPGRSRALTRAEAREALASILAGRADPHQVGAFLTLLRYRGEDAEEIAGLVEAARAEVGIDTVPPWADLDWPSYGAGRTRGAPWFLLAALSLAASGVRVLMHGTNEFTSGIPVVEGLAALGIEPAASLAEARAQIAARNFAYLPLAALSPGLSELLMLRRLLGLRSPLNTATRLLNPANAPCGVDGVFHPPYVDVHLGAAHLMGRERLLVLKGGGGEAERRPFKPVTAQLYRGGTATEIAFPAAGEAGDEEDTDETVGLFAAVMAPRGPLPSRRGHREGDTRSRTGGAGRPRSCQRRIGSIAVVG